MSAKTRFYYEACFRLVFDENQLRIIDRILRSNLIKFAKKKIGFIRRDDIGLLL